MHETGVELDARVVLMKNRAERTHGFPAAPVSFPVPDGA